MGTSEFMFETDRRDNWQNHIINDYFHHYYTYAIAHASVCLSEFPTKSRYHIRIHIHIQFWETILPADKWTVNVGI